jgi:hypothetical protein
VERILPGAQGLRPVVKPVCLDGQWTIQSDVRGGGDNTPSRTSTRVHLSLSKDGDLVADGDITIVRGHFFKDTLSWQCQAVFRMSASNR